MFKIIITQCKKKWHLQTSGITSKTRTGFLNIAVVFNFVAFSLGHAWINTAYADTIEHFPILEKLQQKNKPLAKETQKWMKRWRGIDLDDPEFNFERLSGSTSINLIVRKPDPSDPDGYKAYGSFVPRNGSANFNIEIAYFNLAAILGYDHIFRPTVRYALGPKAMQAFKLLLDSAPITEELRLANKNRILANIATGQPLKGCLKAKKLNNSTAYDAIATIPVGHTSDGIPRKNNRIIAALQASHAQPVKGQQLQLTQGYKGDALQLAREYSIIMTLDVIFQQWDRYSGDNVVIAKDSTGTTHFYSTDNGGADMEKDTLWVKRNLNWFSRYDRTTIKKLKALHNFLLKPQNGFLGYKNAHSFVVDLGLYSELSSAIYVERLKRNIGLLLQRVARVERQFGNKAYLP